MTISLRKDIASDIVEPGVAGVYTADGSYHKGRPVLRHSGGLYTLCVWDGVWEVCKGVGGDAFLWVGVASDLFPADTKKIHWEYDSQQGYIKRSNGIYLSRREVQKPITSFLTFYNSNTQSRYLDNLFSSSLTY